MISDYVDKKIFDSNIAKYSEMTQHNIYCIGDDPYTKEFRMKYRLDNFTNCENLLSANMLCLKWNKHVVYFYKTLVCILIELF